MVLLWIGLCCGHEFWIIVPPEKTRVLCISVGTNRAQPSFWDAFLFLFSGISSAFCRAQEICIEIMKSNKSQRSCVFVCKRIRMNKRWRSLYCDLIVLLWWYMSSLLFIRNFFFSLLMRYILELLSRMVNILGTHIQNGESNNYSY